MKTTPRPSPATTPRWRVKQGTSVGLFHAEDYASARQRAAECGFKSPDSIVLEAYPGEHASANALARAFASWRTRADY